MAWLRVRNSPMSSWWGKSVVVCKSIQYHAAGAHTVPHLAHAIARPNHLSLGASFQKPKFAWSWFSKRFATSGLRDGTVPSALRTNWRRCVMPVESCWSVHYTQPTNTLGSMSKNATNSTTCWGTKVYVVGQRWTTTYNLTRLGLKQSQVSSAFPYILVRKSLWIWHEYNL